MLHTLVVIGKPGDSHPPNQLWTTVTVIHYVIGRFLTHSCEVKVISARDFGATRSANS